jgi:hypothetical protein
MTMTRNHAHPGQRETAAALRVRALELRKQGLTYQAIARYLQVGVGSAHRYVARALADLKKLETAEAEDLRRLELERLDWLLRKLRPRLNQGEPAAVNSAIRISERRARLLGLDLQPDFGGTTTAVTIVNGIDLSVVVGQKPGIPLEGIHQTTPN